MIQEDKFNDLIKDWSNADKSIAIKKLKVSMSESTERVRPVVVENYVKEAITQGIKTGKLLDYPEYEFSSTAKSSFYRENIQSVVKEVELELNIQNTTGVLQMAWSNCEKSKNLVEFRRNFKMYLEILKVSTFTTSDVDWYVEHINTLDKEIEELKDYKRQCNEIFGCLQKDDKEIAIVQKASALNSKGLSDAEVVKVLGITRHRLNYCRSKVKLQSAHTFAQNEDFSDENAIDF
jgi:hypothetical protein